MNAEFDIEVCCAGAGTREASVDNFVKIGVLWELSQERGAFDADLVRLVEQKYSEWKARLGKVCG